MNIKDLINKHGGPAKVSAKVPELSKRTVENWTTESNNKRKPMRWVVCLLWHWLENPPKNMRKVLDVMSSEKYDRKGRDTK